MSARTRIRGRLGSAAPRVLEVRRSDPDQHGSLWDVVTGRHRDPVAAEVDLPFVDIGLDQVHGRRADERGHEQVRRRVEQCLRGVDLLEPPVSDHGDSLPQGHRLDLVVRDVHRRHSEPLVQPRERRAHRDPELGVEIREGLVHEEGNRLAHERAADRDALTLTAGEGGRLAVEELREPERLRSVRNPPRPLLLRDLPPLQPELEVLVDGHMRVQRVVLEHHRDVAVLRRGVADIDAPDHDRAARQLLQSGHQPQERRLPAAGGADEHHELPLADLEADVVDRLDLAREDLRDVVQADARRPPAGSLRDGRQGFVLKQSRPTRRTPSPDAAPRAPRSRSPCPPR